jgi:hypothetical protein
MKFTLTVQGAIVVDQNTAYIQTILSLMISYLIDYLNLIRRIKEPCSNSQSLLSFLNETR